MAAGSRPLGLPGLRFPRHRRGPAAGRQAAARRRDPGAGDPGAALSAYGGVAGRLHRTQRRAASVGQALSQGTLMPSTPLAPHQIERLLEAARSAQKRAHAPYSRFHVGAAVLDDQDRVHAGCNVENAAYPLGMCAEAGALAALIANGGARVPALPVVGGGANLVTPSRRPPPRLPPVSPAPP